MTAPQFLLGCLAACVAGLLTWSLWCASQPPLRFLIKIQTGAATTKRGKVSAAFTRRVAEVAHECQIQTGFVRGVGRGRVLELRFSKKIPPEARMKLRNWWYNAG